MSVKTMKCTKPRSASRVARRRATEIETIPTPTVWYSQRPGTHTQCPGCGLPVVVGWGGDVECEGCSYYRGFGW